MPSIKMTDDELAAFLDEERVLRLATVDDEDWPAVVPVWFVWHDGAFWIWNLNRAKRSDRLAQGGRCAFVVDGGREYVELRGAAGRLLPHLVPDDEVPVEVRRAFSQRYFNTDHPLEPADHHTWFRLEVVTVNTWDFRKQYG